MTTRRLTAAIFAGLLLIGAAGCASGSDDEGSDDNTETDSGSDSGNDSGNDSGSDPDLGDLDDLGDLGELDEALGLDGECFEFAIAYSSIYLSVFGAFDEEAAGEVADQLDELESSVPSEIEDDWNTVRDALQEWADAIANDGLLSDEANDAAAALEEGDVAEANDNIEQWLDENCAG